MTGYMLFCGDPANNCKYRGGFEDYLETCKSLSLALSKVQEYFSVVPLDNFTVQIVDMSHIRMVTIDKEYIKNPCSMDKLKWVSISSINDRGK